MADFTKLSYAGRMTLPDSDESRGVFREVVTTDSYGFRKLKRQGFQPNFLWDVGASWGVASAMMATCWPKAIVWAFEPRADRYAYAVANLKRFPNVRVFNQGLIGYLGESQEKTLAGIAWDGVWRKSPQEVLDDSIASSCLSPASFLAQTPLPLPLEMVKIDIEGCEIGVLQQMQELGMLRSVRHIRGEWHFNALTAIPELLAGTHDARMTPATGNPWHYFEASR